MFPGINPRQMQQMMKKMGMQQEDIDATEVIIKTPEKEIIITKPSIQKINMMGKETFQIAGEIHEREIDTTPEINDDDIKIVVEQAGVDEKTAKEALEKTKGDIAEAVVSLEKE